MPPKVLYCCVVILSLIIFSGCLDDLPIKAEIKENLYFKADGSGSYSFGIDMTETIMPFVEISEEIDDLANKLNKDSNKSIRKEPSMVETLAVEMKGKLFGEAKMGKVQGIKKYNEFVDTTGGKFIVGFSFTFKNTKSLNKAMAAFSNSLANNGSDKSNGESIGVYSYNHEGFSRKMVSYDTSRTQMESDVEMLKARMSDFTYTVIYEFEKEIADVVAAGADITREGKTVILKYDIEGMVKSQLKSEIRLK